MKIEKTKSGALKEFSGKPPISLVPSILITGAAEAYNYGAQKYHAHNWRLGRPYSLEYSALLRHLLKWNEGQDLDDESGLPHLSHAAACLGMLMGTVQAHPENDDRHTALQPKQPNNDK